VQSDIPRGELGCLRCSSPRTRGPDGLVRLGDDRGVGLASTSAGWQVDLPLRDRTEIAVMEA
jgi:hypothetical protein